MAIDTWLFDQCYRGLLPPTLRFYTWEPAAISLGRNQRHWPIHWQSLTWHEGAIDLVRRPTGGRAVLHEGDLTYAIALSHPTRDRRQAYRELCQFLIDGWQTLGVNLQFGQSQQNYTQKANCFATATKADLVLDTGFKLIGSAQAWQGQTVLQHGSMRLNPNPKLIEQVFGNRSETAPIPTTTLPGFSASEIMTQLIQAAQICFSVTFTHQPLSQQEWAAIIALQDSPLAYPETPTQQSNNHCL